MARIILSLLILIPVIGQAQEAPVTCKNLVVLSSELPLDSLTIIPETITIQDREDVACHYDANTGMITFENFKTPDSITVCYQTIPYQLHKTYVHKSLSEYQTAMKYNSAESKPSSAMVSRREELFPTDNLQKSGSLTRGVSFGNSQNVVVNSALNLQLDGKLGDNLFVRASITDQDIPFQPEGNTAQIQDFDNIYLELYNDKFSLKGGDIVLRNGSSEFLRYYKNVQGGLLNTRYKIGEKSSAETSLGISVAKGKFATIQLDVDEGVLGPYRIRIPDASEFTIIMANSERVYLDGKQLQRGFNHDYIIDYNRAEIQFTSQVLITKFSRVRIDVEYSDQNYSRTILAASHAQDFGKAGLAVNYYSEKDNPNNPLTISLTDENRELLQSIGDDLEKAWFENARPADFNPNEILYTLVDTVDLDGILRKVFRHSTDPELELYRVSFSDLGSGKGNYTLTQSTTNGRVYAWVSPVDGIPQGNFAPVSRLPVPNGKDMLTLAGHWNLSNHEKVFIETAFSGNDQNRASTLDSYDDRGFAVKGGLVSERRPVSFLKNYNLTARVDYEFDDAYFNPIDRFRYIEFDRDWNYDPQLSGDRSADHIFQAEAGIEKDVFNRLFYKLVRRKRNIFVDGTQHYAGLAQSIGRMQVNSDLFAMRNGAAAYDARWNRINTEIFYKSALFVPGYKFSLDENTLFSPESDSIIGSAMNFREHTFFLNSNDTLKTRFGASYTIREDRSPQAGELGKSDESGTARFFVQSDIGRDQRLNVLVTYRNNTNYQVADGPKQEETLITRVDWYASFFKRHIRSDLTYAIGNGRQLRREFVYVMVPTGQGTHTWRDDNGDGIQDLSEFYLAINPDEKNFIKVFVPTSVFVPAYENNFNYRLNMEMPRSWRDEEGIKKLLSQISNTSAWSVVKHITSEDLAPRLLPFYNNIPAEELLSLRESIRTRFFFNRSNPGFGADAGYQRNSSKLFLTQGFDSRNKEDYSVNVRLNLSRRYNLKMLYLWGPSGSSSDFMQGRNFLIYQKKFMPEVAWQPGTNLRLTMAYAYSDKINVQGEPNETAKIHEVLFSSRISKAASFSLDSNLRLSEITYDGRTNTPVSYEMLEAMQPGTNLNWNFTLQKKLLQGLQLSAVYEGRKSEDRAAIHIGRMQVSALF